MPFNIPFKQGGADTVFARVTSFQLAAGQAAGIIATITPTAGKRIRLESLYNLSTGAEASISIEADGNVEISGALTGNGADNNDNMVGWFGIGKFATASHEPMVFKTDEVITIIKTGASTVNKIRYSYSELD